MADAILQLDAVAWWDGSELEIAISGDSLQLLITSLRKQTPAIIKLVNKEPSDHRKIQIVKTIESNDRLVLNIEGRVATFSGSRAAFLLLADNLEFLGNQWSDGEAEHLHLDPVSNAILFSPSSEAFIISPRKVGAT